MSRSIACVLFLLALWPSVHVGDAKEKVKPKATLEQAIRDFQKGLSSDKKEAREKALLAMLPTPKDIEYLFPKHADKLKPLNEKGIKFLLENVDKIAEEVTRGGEIKEVLAIDVRKEPDRTKQYERLIKMIPKDVPLFDIHVTRAKVSSGGGTYLYLHDRWLWIKDLDSVPEFLDKLK